MQVVTVNDYLARRDSEWVGQVHRFLGLQVGLVQQGLDVRFLTQTSSNFLSLLCFYVLLHICECRSSTAWPNSVMFNMVLVMLELILSLCCDRRLIAAQHIMQT